MIDYKEPTKKELEDFLQEINYSHLNSDSYVPSVFALRFINFIKLVNGDRGESNKSPPVHMKMLDVIGHSDKSRIANLCHRGFGKTTICPEYLILYLALFGGMPNLPFIDGIIYVADSMENGAKSLRKNIEYRYTNSDFLKEWIPEVTFTDSRMEFVSKGGKHRLGVRLFGGKTNIRGIKIFGKRPQLAVLDDIVSDEDSRSTTNLESIRVNIYNGVVPALDPQGNKIIFNGTPFNKQDPLLQAIESGEWETNVFPICEKFPCTKEEFVGSWEDRFDYDYVMDKYRLNKSMGRVSSFYQEYMLQITSEEDRLIQDDEILQYSRTEVLKNKDNYNFYITTDFATSTKQSADFSVISVWAYDKDGNWYWVDGMCERVTFDKSIDRLFGFVAQYKPQQVGVEITGQQGAFISVLQREMLNRDIWFNFASSHGRNPGIRPTADKLSRFNMVVPWFKMGKMHFPKEMANSIIIREFMEQLRLTTVKGIKGKDDCLDTISMLTYLNAWKPNETSILLPDEPVKYGSNVFDIDNEIDIEPNGISSYL